MTRSTIILALVCAPAIVRADEPAVPAPEPTPAPPPVEPVKPTLEDSDEIVERIADLEQKSKEIPKLKRDNDELRSQLKELGQLKRSVGITAFIDVGAFAVAGNGTGIRSDFLHQHYPQYGDSVSGQWVFMGDPFTTMINSLGDPAETGDSREVETDAINSSGRPSVLVNSVGLAIGKSVTDELSISALAQLLPRPGTDSIEITYAYAIYRPTQKYDLSFEAGKIDSVLGVEYRRQDSHKRVTVTPSLICRYTCGRPIGVDARYVGERVNASAAIINGDNFEERFEPKPELRANKLPTAAAHLEYKLPVGQGLRLGVSTAVGPQEGQSDVDVLQWHYGLDVDLIDYKGFDVTAEFVQGKQRGDTEITGIENRAKCDVAQCLAYKGAYLLVSRQFERWKPYGRFEWRDATHRRGADFVYEARSLRATVGLNVAVNSHVHAKVEYNWNRELGVPDFPHDVITSSIVISTD